LLSHSLLDSLTTGGKGVGWLWPWREERFFAPWQVIRVAPFKLEAYLTARGEAVILSELYWVWLPGVLLMLGLLVWGRGGSCGIGMSCWIYLGWAKNKDLDTHLLGSGCNVLLRKMGVLIYLSSDKYLFIQPLWLELAC
jgi:hypothetical protein